MTVNINIKANVDNLSLCDIYMLLTMYSTSRKNDVEIIEYNGFKFKIEAKADMSIDYIITELK